MGSTHPTGRHSCHCLWLLMCFPPFGITNQSVFGKTYKYPHPTQPQSTHLHKSTQVLNIFNIKQFARNLCIISVLWLETISQACWNRCRFAYSPQISTLTISGLIYQLILFLLKKFLICYKYIVFGTVTLKATNTSHVYNEPSHVQKLILFF